MHRMIETLPATDACRQGHAARLMQDLRGPQFGGGHFVECACTRTNVCSHRNRAVTEWRRSNGLAEAAAAPVKLRRVR